MHRLDELRGMTLIKPREAIESCVIQPGLTLLTAPSRSGKTVLGVQMAMCQARGIPLFEEYKTIQSPTLIFEWDDKQGKQALQDFEAQCRASQPGMPVHFIAPDEDDDEPLTLADPEFLPYLRGKIQKAGAGLVVLDSDTALRGLRSAGSDIVKLEANELTMLAKLARDMDVAIILIHHDSKSSAHLDWAQRGAGTFAVNAAAEGNIRIARYPDLPEAHPARLVSIRSRRLRGAEFTVLFREETLDYDLAVTGAAAPYFPQLVDLYSHFRGVPFTQIEASKELGWRRSHAYNLLNRFLSSGVLRKESTAFTWDPSFKPKGIL
jgi:hypothetical protein